MNLHKNPFTKKGVSYDFNYLKEEDLEKPQIPKLYRACPQLANDPVINWQLLAADPNAPPEVSAYFANRALESIRKETKLLESFISKMNTVDIKNDPPVYTPESKNAVDR